MVTVLLDFLYSHLTRVPFTLYFPFSVTDLCSLPFRIFFVCLVYPTFSSLFPFFCYTCFKIPLFTLISLYIKFFITTWLVLGLQPFKLI